MSVAATERASESERSERACLVLRERSEGGADETSILRQGAKREAVLS